MKRSIIVAAACAAAAAFGSVTCAQEAASSSATTLREAAKGKMLIGCAIMSQALDDPKHAELIASQFSAITAENEMKPDAVHPSKGTFTFDAGDKLAAFAASHDMKLIGHNLLWHNQAPKFLFADDAGKPLSRDVALANLKEHITTVMQHFKGKVIGWDVVNEAVDDAGPYLRDTPARKAIGDDYIVQAFKFAAEADPEAELYYNDYNLEQGYKIEKGLRLIKELKDAGCKVTAVGIQGHFLLGSPSPADIDAAIEKFGALGVKVHFTEVDVDVLPRGKGGGADITATERAGADPYKAGLPADVEQKLADRYREIFAVFAKHPGVVARVTLWGTHDGTSWLNNYPVRGRTNYAMLFDRQMKPRPAFAAVVEALRAMPAAR